MNAETNGVISIGGDIVDILYGCNKMIGMFLYKVFDSEVIYDEAECKGACDMVENSRSVACGYISICG